MYQERFKPTRQLGDGIQDMATRVYDQLQNGMQSLEPSPADGLANGSEAAAPADVSVDK